MNHKEANKHFAAFIITYERESILGQTIQTIFAQTFRSLFQTPFER